MRTFTVTIRMYRFERTYSIQAYNEEQAGAIAESLFNAEIGFD